LTVVLAMPSEGVVVLSEAEPLIVPVTAQQPGCAKRCARLREQLRLACKTFKHTISSLTHSPFAQFMKASDIQMKFFAMLTAASYYADIALDGKQLALFFSKKQYIYLSINCTGILMGLILDMCEGNTPLVGPGRVVASMWSRQQYLPEECKTGMATSDMTDRDLQTVMRESAQRFERLKNLCSELGTTSMTEACVESATSLLIQGYALLYERYTETERFWLAVSVLQGVCSTAWAFCSLDDGNRILRSVTVSARGETKSVPVVSGSLALSKRVALMLVRLPEVATRIGSVLLLLVSIKLAHPSAMERPLVLMCSGAIILISLASDTILFRCFGSQGAWKRAPFSAVALASPVWFPASLPGMGPPAWIFHILRNLQTLILIATSLWLNDWHIEEMRTAFASPAAQKNCNEAEDVDTACASRFAEATVAATIFCFAVHILFNVLLLAVSPKLIPEKTRSAWADLLGACDGQSQETTIFPDVPQAERQLFVAYGLLPHGQLLTPLELRAWSASQEQQNEKSEKSIIFPDMPEEDLRTYLWRRGRSLTVQCDYCNMHLLGDQVIECVRKAAPGLQILRITGMYHPTDDSSFWGELMRELAGQHGDSLQQLAITARGSQRLPEACTDALAQGFFALRALRGLKLESLVPDSMARVAEALSGFASTLEELSIEGCIMTDEGAKQLAEVLRIKCLKRVSLASNGEISVAGWEHLTASLSTGPVMMIEELNVSRCKLTDEKLEPFVQTLGKFRALKRLRVGDSEITVSGWRRVAESLSGGPAQVIEELDVSNGDLSDEKLSTLLRELHANSINLRKIDLRNNRALDLGFLFLASSPLPSLRQVLRDPPELRVSGSICPSEAIFVQKLMVKGARSPAAWIGRCCRLAELQILPGPGMQEDDWKSLASALGDGPSVSLTTLQLICCNLSGAKELKHVAPMLPASLEKLDVSSHELLGVEGVGLLADRLPALLSLKELAIYRCALADEAAEILACGLAERAQAGGAKITVYAHTNGANFSEELERILRERLPEGFVGEKSSQDYKVRIWG